MKIMYEITNTYLDNIRIQKAQSNPKLRAEMNQGDKKNSTGIKKKLKTFSDHLIKASEPVETHKKYKIIENLLLGGTVLSIKYFVKIWDTIDYLGLMQKETGRSSKLRILSPFEKNPQFFEKILS